MKEAIIHLDDTHHPIDIHIDGKDFPINAFILLTSVPVDPPGGHILCFGNSHTIGNLLMGFWANSCKTDPLGAAMIETVCRDIIREATRLRGGAWDIADLQGVSN